MPVVHHDADGRFRIDVKKMTAYINNMFNRCFYVYDLKDDRIVKTVPTGSNPNNLKLSPGKRYIYLSIRGPNNPKGYELRSLEDGKIQIFDSEKNYRLVEDLPAGNQPIGISLTSDGKILAVSNYRDNTIDFFACSLED